MTKKNINNIKVVNRIKRSSRLYHRSSVITGIGSLFNIAGNYFEFNSSESESEVDSKAIKRDWEIVGNDLHEAIETVENS